MLLSAIANDTGAAPGAGVGDTLTLSFDSATNTPPLDAGVFGAAAASVLGALSCAWMDDRTCVMRLASPAVRGGAASAAVRISALRAVIGGAYGLRSRDLSSVVTDGARAVVGGGWGAAIASVAGATLQVCARTPVCDRGCGAHGDMHSRMRTLI